MILGQLLEKVYRAVHADIIDGVATGGTATTLVDAALSGRYQAQKFKNWIVFISRTSDGLSPQSKFAIITGYTTDGTATFATMTDSVQAGDEYAFCKPDIPLYTLIKLCNDGLRALGHIPQIDISLTVVSTTIRYTLPAALNGIQPSLVFFRDATTHERAHTPNWYIEPAGSGTARTLVFKALNLNPYNGYKIVIHYEADHEALTAYNSPVNETLHDELVMAACVEKAFQWKMFPRQRKVDVANWSMAKGLLEEAKRNHPFRLPIRDQQRVPIDIYNV